VNRHKNVIVQCVQDADISIRRRALDLACALVNDGNIEVFMEVLLQFMEDSDVSFKPKLVEKICLLVESHATSPQWHVDTMAQLLEKGGAHMQDRSARAFLVMISATPSVQGYAVRSLYRCLFDNLDQASTNLLTVALWCIGEFGEKLLSGEGLLSDEIPLKVNEAEVLALIEQVMKGGAQSREVMEYALTCLVKLSDRFPAKRAQVQDILSRYKQSSLLELQQRACEFRKLFDHDKVLSQVLEAMPSLLEGGAEDGGDESQGNGAGGAESQMAAMAADPMGDLLGGMDVGGAMPGVGDAMPSGANLLDDLLGGGGGGGGGAASSPLSSPMVAPAGDPLMDLLGGGGGPVAPVASTSPALPTTTPYEKNGVTVSFAMEKDPLSSANTVIHATYTNFGPAPVSNFVVQCAVPKYIQLRMEPATGNALPAGGSGNVAQKINLSNSLEGQKPLMMRLKVDYRTQAGAQVSDIVEVKL